MSKTQVNKRGVIVVWISHSILGNTRGLIVSQDASFWPVKLFVILLHVVLYTSWGSFTCWITEATSLCYCHWLWFRFTPAWRRGCGTRCLMYITSGLLLLFFYLFLSIPPFDSNNLWNNLGNKSWIMWQSLFEEQFRLEFLPFQSIKMSDIDSWDFFSGWSWSLFGNAKCTILKFGSLDQTPNWSKVFWILHITLIFKPQRGSKCQWISHRFFSAWSTTDTALSRSNIHFCGRWFNHSLAY